MSEGWNRITVTGPEGKVLNLTDSDRKKIIGKTNDERISLVDSAFKLNWC
ncbi:MAG: hypothetical protein WBP83_15000 [Nitrososphaeraceae archaeon]